MSMSGGYTIIASVLLYLLLLQTLDSPRMNPGRAAVLFAFGSFAVLAVAMMLENVARGLPVLTAIVTTPHALNLLLQLGVAYGIFYKVERINDEYLTFVFWGGLGVALIFYVVPALIQQVTILF